LAVGTSLAPLSAAPLLYVIPILDGSSYEELKTFFKYRIVELDRASGVKLHILDIGDPDQSGTFYKTMQSPEEREQDVIDGRAFAEAVHATGRTDHVHLHAMSELAKGLALAPGETPCLVFVRPGRFVSLETLPLKREWYSSSDARVRCGRLLEAWLTDLKLDGIAPPGSEGDPLVRTIHHACETLTRLLDEEFRGDPAPDGSLGFERLVDGWRLRFGGTTVMVKHSVGMNHLRQLLSNPGRTFSAWSLQTAKKGRLSTDRKIPFVTRHDPGTK
jgi:hypothetical protein